MNVRAFLMHCLMDNNGMKGDKNVCGACFSCRKIEFFWQQQWLFLTYFTVRLSDCGNFEERLTGQKHFTISNFNVVLREKCICHHMRKRPYIFLSGRYVTQRWHGGEIWLRKCGPALCLSVKVTEAELNRREIPSWRVDGCSKQHSSVAQRPPSG